MKISAVLFYCRYFSLFAECFFAIIQCRLAIGNLHKWHIDQCADCNTDNLCYGSTNIATRSQKSIDDWWK
jgi:hypothetical protein